MGTFNGIVLDNLFLTSRSAIQTYHDCKQLRYLQYHYNNTGIVADYRGVPVTTGGCIHTGVGHLLKLVKANKLKKDTPEEVLQAHIDDASTLAVNEYHKLCESRQVGGPKASSNKDFTVGEQTALTEALVRLWAMKELPRITQFYKVVAVEEEVLVPIVDNEGYRIGLQVRVDAILQSIQSNELFAYSLKSLKDWYERSDKSYKIDLQGVTEVYGTEEWIRARNFQINKGADELDKLRIRGIGSSKMLNEVIVKLRSKLLPERVQGVKFCILIKGGTKKEENSKGEKTGKIITYNPFIRGYRNEVAGNKRFGKAEVQYAHSWFFHNSENKSGKGALGKGWAPFNVWESEEWTVKTWMQAIEEGKIQPNYGGDIFQEHIITPPEVFRSKKEQIITIAEIERQEARIMQDLEELRRENEGELPKDPIASYPLFPRNRNRCYFPEECPNIPICHKRVNPMVGDETFKFVSREPHHEPEVIKLQQQGNTISDKEVSSNGSKPNY